MQVPDATKEPGTIAVVHKVGQTGSQRWQGRLWAGEHADGDRPACTEDRGIAPPFTWLRHPLPGSPSLQRGYMLNERVVRAAEVGVTRAQD